MKIKNISSTLLASICVVTLFPDRGRSQPSPDFLAFCSTVRDQYISNFKHKYQSQRYSGAGEAGVGIGKGKIGFGGSGQYDWQRTWDETDASQKSEYSSKNCDEVLKQWGQVSVAEIQANASEAIARIQNEGYKYAEDTKRIVADIELEGLKDTNSTAQSIAETNANAAVDIATINGNTDQRIAETNAGAVQYIADKKFEGLIDTNSTNQNIADINANANQNIAATNANSAQNIAATNANANQNIAATNANAAQNIAKTQARANTTSTIANTLGTVIGTSITSSNNKKQQQLAAEIERERIAADLEKARIAAQIEREKIIATNNSNVSPVDRLLAQWNWTRVACYPGSVFISGLSNETVCVSPTNLFPPGQYAYDRATNRLVLLNEPYPTNSIPPNQNYHPPQIIDTPAINPAPQSSDYPDSSI